MAMTTSVTITDIVLLKKGDPLPAGYHVRGHYDQQY